MKGGQTEVFDGKTLSSLLQDIYNISTDKRSNINSLIKEMSKLIVSPADVVNIAPIIQQYLETSVKNDDQLTKVATIVQRIISAESYQGSGGENPEILSDKEREQLLQNAFGIKNAFNQLEEELRDIPKIPSSSSK